MKNRYSRFILALNTAIFFALSAMLFACKTTTVPDAKVVSSIATDAASEEKCWTGKVRFGQVPGLTPGITTLLVGARSVDAGIALWAPFDFCTAMTSRLRPDSCRVTLSPTSCKDPMPAFNYQLQALATDGSFEKVTEDQYDQVMQPEALKESLAASERFKEAIDRCVQAGDLDRMITESLANVATMGEPGEKHCASLNSVAMTTGTEGPRTMQADIFLNPDARAADEERIEEMLHRASLAKCESELASPGNCQSLPLAIEENESPGPFLYWSIKMQNPLRIRTAGASSGSGQSAFPESCDGTTIRHQAADSLDDLGQDNL